MISLSITKLQYRTPTPNFPRMNLNKNFSIYSRGNSLISYALSRRSTGPLLSLGCCFLMCRSMLSLRGIDRPHIGHTNTSLSFKDLGWTELICLSRSFLKPNPIWVFWQSGCSHLNDFVCFTLMCFLACHLSTLESHQTEMSELATNLIFHALEKS
jgi:hypothetical protein